MGVWEYARCFELHKVGLPVAMCFEENPFCSIVRRETEIPWKWKPAMPVSFFAAHVPFAHDSTAPAPEGPLDFRETVPRMQAWIHLDMQHRVALWWNSCSCRIARRQQLSSASARTQRMPSSCDIAAGSRGFRRRRAMSTATTDVVASELKRDILICASQVQRERG